jgi:hypothetical protein
MTAELPNWPPGALLIVNITILQVTDGTVEVPDVLMAVNAEVMLENLIAPRFGSR